MLLGCIKGGVGVDGRKIFDVDRRPDRCPGGTPAPPEARGREPPSSFFFLDLLPRWEKGFPSGPWSPWCGRGESPSKIRYVSLSFSVYAFLDSTISPFLIFLEIRNSYWAEILTQFASGD